MQNHFEFSHETNEAFEIRTVRARMDAMREAQSEAWGAICRTAGREIDFEVDDLVALEAKAQAEFDRAKAEARAAEAIAAKHQAAVDAWEARIATTDFEAELRFVADMQVEEAKEAEWARLLDLRGLHAQKRA